MSWPSVSASAVSVPSSATPFAIVVVAVDHLGGVRVDGGIGTVAVAVGEGVPSPSPSGLML